MSEWRAGEALIEAADQLAGSELHSALLEVMRRRTRARRPRDLLAQLARDRFVAPAAVDARTTLAIDGALFAAAAAFAAVELSPLAPLGCSSVVAPTDQHRVVSALRGTEVVSDPTNMMALICAQQLRTHRAGPPPTVKLATSHRCVRAQPAPPGPGFAQHFRLFAVATATRETAHHAATVAALAEQIAVLLDGLAQLEHAGYRFGARRVDILATQERAEVGDRLAAGVAAHVPTARRALDHRYYSGGLRFMLWVTAPDGSEVPLGDGGAFDWMAQLTADHRAVFVASGLGSQLIAARFRG